MFQFEQVRRIARTRRSPIGAKQFEALQYGKFGINSSQTYFNLTEWHHSFPNYYFSVSSIQLREVELVRLCLKHFRQQGYDAAFKALQEQTNVSLEDPKMSELHTALVVQGDFQKAENFIEKAVNGMFQCKKHHAMR